MSIPVSRRVDTVIDSWRRRAARSRGDILRGLVESRLAHAAASWQLAAAVTCIARWRDSLFRTVGRCHLATVLLPCPLWPPARWRRAVTSLPASHLLLLLCCYRRRRCPRL